MFVEVHNADCLEILKTLNSGSVDMVFADPPFNVGKKYGTANDSRLDYRDWCREWIKECFRVLKDSGVFWLMTLDRHLEWKMPIMAEYGVFINLIKWRNVSASHSKRCFWNSCQPILVYGKTSAYKFNTYAVVRRILPENLRWGGYSTGPKGQLLDYWDDIPFVYAGSISHPEAIIIPGTNKKAHPTQMPVALAERAILFTTDKGDVVLDPFMGSGTVGVACVRTDRSYIGIEIDSDYYALSRKRIADEQRQPHLFVEQ